MAFNLSVARKVLEQFNNVFLAGDVVRIQLAPDGESFRYDFDSNGQWFDLGYGGPWVDAQVMDVSPDYIACMEYVVPDTGEVKNFNFPLEGHAAFHPLLPQMEGWPRPPRARIPMPACDCGCETAKDGGTHYSWCSKKEWMDKHGVI